jgi:hypothetical protein
MLKISLVFVAGLIAPLMIWLMVPTLMCLAALGIVSLPIAIVLAVFRRPRRSLALSAAAGVPAASLVGADVTGRELAA